MNKNQIILEDRINKIQEVVNKYGIDNFYISFSGGKDSTVLSSLVDMALPDNKIPRVFSDTGIELNIIKNFVASKMKNDSRFIIIKPSVKIKEMLEKEGYPFKSKKHSEWVSIYQRHNTLDGRIGLQHYLGISTDGVKWANIACCPDILRYQFSPENTLKISDKCCYRLKEEPLKKWEKENNKPYSFIGLMREEGGRRFQALCLAFKNGHFKNFQPLVTVSKEWEEWFIKEYNIEICDIYNEPYNFKRTGCKGCPFAPNLQRVLDTLEKYFPEERKQCEYIWKPVYDEYRRLGYRLKRKETEDAVH